MLIVRLCITLIELDLCLNEMKVTTPSDLRKNCLDHQKILNATYEAALSGISGEASYFSLSIAKSDSTENLISDAKKLVKSLQLDECVDRLSVLSLLEKFLLGYLQLLKTLTGRFNQAYLDIHNALLQKSDNTLLWILEELATLDDLIKPVIPLIADIQKISLSDNLNSIYQTMTKAVFLHWPAIIQSLTKLAVDREFYEKMLTLPMLADQFMVILDVPVQLERLLTNSIDLDVNISRLHQQKNWKLAKRSKELLAASSSLFIHADTRKKTFAALREIMTAKDLSQAEREEIEMALKAIFSHEVENKLVIPDFSSSDSPISRHRAGRSLAVQLNKMSERSVQLHLEPHDASTASTSTPADSIILRDPNSRIVRARVFSASASTSPEMLAKAANTVSFGHSKLAPFIRRGFKEFLLDQHASQTKEMELQYIEQLNRSSLRAFYIAVCSKFQAAYVGYLALASGKVQASNNVNGYCGSLCKLLGAALGPMGGVIFNVLGESIHLISQRRTVVDATKISYLGTLESANAVIEQFARKLTLQYELQIRLLKSVEEDNSRTQSGSTFFKFKQFIGSSRELFKNNKILTADDSPQEMLADYVIAMIFSNLLLAEKAPNNAAEFAEFLPTIFHRMAFDNDNKLYNLLGFFKFNVHHNPNPWHAIDIFRAPRIAVQNKEGSIEYWKSTDEENTQYLWRSGTIEEAQALRYVIEPSHLAVCKK